MLTIAQVRVYALTIQSDSSLWSRIWRFVWGIYEHRSRFEDRRGQVEDVKTVRLLATAFRRQTAIKVYLKLRRAEQLSGPHRSRHIISLVIRWAAISDFDNEEFWTAGAAAVISLDTKSCIAFVIINASSSQNWSLNSHLSYIIPKDMEQLPIASNPRPQWPEKPQRVLLEIVTSIVEESWCR